MLKSALIVAMGLFASVAEPSWAAEPALAVGTNSAFSHTLETAGSPEAIWRLWTDVPSWKSWDQGLREARMSGEMTLGSKGQIIPLSGAPADFEITAFDPGKSYTLTMRFPSARLTVTRSIVGKSPTKFRHEIQFNGPEAQRWADILGPGFRAALPPTMSELAGLAESAAPTR